MKVRIARVVIATGLLTASYTALGAPTMQENAQKEIAALVRTFQSSISAKDGDKLKTLFLPDGSNWWSVLDDATYAAVKQKRPGASRLFPGDFRKFADFIKTTTHSPKEEFSHVRIQTDGMVGTVYFDYAFFIDGKQTNHGVETWQVLKTANGWKISALVYSEIDDRTN